MGSIPSRLTTLCVLLVVCAVALHAQRASTLEKRVHDLVNAERQKARVTALAWDDGLAAIARAHSRDMAKRGFFAHVNPDGEDPTARGRRAHYECRKVLSTNTDRIGLAENLYEASGSSLNDIEHRSVRGWMNSPGHRQNILDKTSTKTGIGIAEAGGTIYITQLFC